MSIVLAVFRRNFWLDDAATPGQCEARDEHRGNRAVCSTHGVGPNVRCGRPGLPGVRPFADPWFTAMAVPPYETVPHDGTTPGSLGLSVI